MTRSDAIPTPRTLASTAIEILENMSDAFVAIDREWRFVYVNGATERIVGRRREEMLGRTVWESFPLEGTAFERACRRAMHEGVSVHFDHYYAPLDIWIEDTVYPAENGITIYARDITERKRSEEALGERQRLIEQLVETAPVVLTVLDLDTGRHTYVSRDVLVLHGYTRDEISAINHVPFELFHPEDVPRIEENLARLQRDTPDGINELEYRIRHRNGEWRWLSSRTKPFKRSDDGRVRQVASATIDITERKRAEEQLGRSFDHLRALAARLQDVREEERARVARQIHDELGQALTGIKIDVASLIKELTPNQHQPMKRAESILKLADETIQVVRRLATELRPGILDLGLVAAVEWATEEFQARTGIACRVSLPDGEVGTDAERSTAFFRILQEALTNVARHANATAVEVRLAREAGGLSLDVHDNGSGFDEAALRPGRSLGLLGMRERALLLGGELTIHSASGEGTTVSVRVPGAMGT